MNRVILHSDLNAFYASVEIMLNPGLRGKAVAVCGSTEERHGIVLAKSEMAKKAGVKTGMVNWEARQQCPGLIMVPPQYEEYLKVSQLVAWYIPEDGRPEEKFTLTPEGLLEGDGRYSINVDGELVAEVYMDAMQVESTTFDHSVLKTSHVLVKDDKIDIITGGTLNMKGADINLSAGGKLKMTSASDTSVFAINTRQHRRAP